MTPQQAFQRALGASKKYTEYSIDYILNLINDLLVFKTLNDVSLDVSVFTDIVDDTVHDEEIEEDSVNGTIIMTEKELQSTISSGYKEFEEVDKTEYATEIIFV